MRVREAFDASTSEEVRRWRWHLPISASVLATAGDLVFCGMPSGEFNAFDAQTGELLWQFQTGSGHHSSPTTYSVDGRQYIAVPVGWSSWVEGFAPGMMGGPHGDALFVFALPEIVIAAHSSPSATYVTGKGCARYLCRPATIGGEEVTAMDPIAARSHSSEWEAPEFEEIGCAPEVTMYVARWED